MTFTTIDPSLTPSVQLNILDNAGFEIWQRGTSFNNPLTGNYTADRWNLQLNNSVTSTVTRESTIVDSGAFSFKLNITATTASYMLFYQNIENFQAYQGKTLTLSMRVYSNAPIRIAIFPGSGNEILSSPHSGGNVWQTLTVTAAIPTNAPSIWAGFGWDSTVTGVSPSISTSYIDSATLVIGPNAASFVPLNPQQDLARCQRFYQTVGGSNNLEIYSMTRDASHNYFFFCRQFFVPMRVAPTMTVTPVQIALVQDAIQGTAALGADQANWTMINDGIDTQVFNFLGQRSTANSTFSNAQAQISWTASADL
jgi:hypothetical protein